MLPVDSQRFPRGFFTIIERDTVPSMMMNIHVTRDDWCSSNIDNLGTSGLRPAFRVIVCSEAVDRTIDDKESSVLCVRADGPVKETGGADYKG